MKKINNKLSIVFRRLTARWRALPHFLIIGAQKSGTTSMHAYLSQHPQIVSAKRKEIHFFDRETNTRDNNFHKNLSGYKSYFPLKFFLGKRKITFEATPMYLFSPEVPEKIHRMLPNIKLIVLLRNPTDRAISQYYFEKKRNPDILPLWDVLLKEEQLINNALLNKNYQDPVFSTLTIKSRGIYYEQIQRFLKYFSKEQLLVICSENFFNDPQRILKRIFKFVGVSKDVRIKDLSAHLTNFDKEIVENETYEYLDHFFEEPNQKLFDLIGETYDWSRTNNNLGYVIP